MTTAVEAATTNGLELQPGASTPEPRTLFRPQIIDPSVRLRKTIFTLNIGDYNPEITKLTRPLLMHFAKKIGADIVDIKERKFPTWPVVYEKLQIYELAQQFGPGWNIYIDSDTLINPDMFDPTDHMSLNTVAHNGKDMAGNRWRYDRFFLRDGRHIGSCNWFAIASHLCVDLWKPLDDLTLEQALDNIFPTVPERNGIIDREHLIDDYTLSRNIAKFGLKHDTVQDICKRMGFEAGWLWHKYNLAEDQKIGEMREVLKVWRLQ